MSGHESAADMARDRNSKIRQAFHLGILEGGQGRSRYSRPAPVLALLLFPVGELCSHQSAMRPLIHAASLDRWAR